MSKLTLINTALSDNSKIHKVGATTKYELLAEKDGPHHSVGIYLGLIEPSFKVVDLNTVLLELSHGNPHDRCVDEFRTSERDGGYSFYKTTSLHFGKLKYHEVFGYRTTPWRVVVTDQEMLLSEEWVNRETWMEERRELTRQITVHLYPSVEIATKACEAKSDDDCRFRMILP